MMLEKLRDAEKVFLRLEEELAAPDAASDRAAYLRRMRDYKALTPIIEAYRSYRKAQAGLQEAEALLADRHETELHELAQEQLTACKSELETLETRLKILLLPHDPDDDKNVILEIRAGAGGEEAALFAATLFRMYSMFADRMHWKLEVISENETELGGYREISFMLEGEGVYAQLKYESGVHRVQRVPETETHGEDSYFHRYSGGFAGSGRG